MGNGVGNASFLDGGASWFVAGTFSADESTRGGPGRIVGLASGGDIVSTVGPAVTAGQVVEVFGHHAATGGASTLYLKVGGSQVAVPLISAGDGNPRRGIPSSFRFSYGRVAAPGTGTATIRVVGSGTAIILKPMIEAAPRAERSCWQPGPHANEDLDLPSWPTTLPDVVEWEASPVATRKSFAGDSNVPIFRRVATTPRQTVRASFSLDLEQRDALDQFFRGTPGPFWFTRPDTRQLCRARWTADGDPADNGAGRTRRTSVELLLEVA